MELQPPPEGSTCQIVACDENRAIGFKGRLPWRIREDWNWFMGHTRGGCMLIGRISFAAMLRGGHVNADRCFFVVSRDNSLAGPHAQVFPDTQSALAAAKRTGRTVWICGGTRIYEETLPVADRLYLTQVHTQGEGDAWMPDWTGRFSRTLYTCDGSDARHSYTFQVLLPG